MPAPAPAARLRALGLRPSHRLSQSFLCSSDIAAFMVHAAEVEPNDILLEIGPGLGVLTEQLVRTKRPVICVEVDATLARALSGAVGDPANLEVVHGDALAVDFTKLLAEPYVVVASLPYHVATSILAKLAFHAPRPRRMVVMLQEEVARRITAPSGSMTYLSAALGTVANSRVMRRVPPGAFYPRPRVRSAIVRIDLHPRPTVAVDSLESFLEFLRAGFARPRGQLHNSLAQGLGLQRAGVHALIEASGVEPTRRPARLSLEEWATLYRTGFAVWGLGAGSQGANPQPPTPNP